MARHPAYGKTYEPVLADGAPCPICGSLMVRHHLPDLHHTDAAGR